MTKGLPTYVRRDVFTGPTALVGSKLPFWIPFVKRYLLGGNRLLARLFVLAPGSRQNFYHFLIGYLLPLVHAQDRRRFEKFLALDCGPLMTPILEETLERRGYSFEIVPPEAIEKPVLVEAWDRLDNPWRSPGAVHATANKIRQAWQGYTCTAKHCPRSENLLIQRSGPHEHYMDGRSEFRGYGTSRRAVSNLQEVSKYLARHGNPHSVYEPGIHCLGCQIETFSAARKLLGFRGAEWANLIWSPPETRVRMLDHKPPAKTLGRFMTRLTIRHEFAIVDSPKSPESPQEALRFFSEA